METLAPDDFEDNYPQDVWERLNWHRVEDGDYLIMVKNYDTGEVKRVRVG